VFNTSVIKQGLYVITLDQKVYVYDRDEWIQAKNIKRGMMLLSRHDDPCEVTDVLRVRDEGLTRVFSLSVADQTNFYANGILIHSPNTGACDE
jgi:intein/homing endonuclease